MPRMIGYPLIASLSGSTADMTLSKSNLPRPYFFDAYRRKPVTKPRWPSLTQLKNPTLAFKYLDAIYSQFSEADKNVWRNAVKRPRMSGYGLWMKEAMFTVTRGYPPPRVPSPSGGFACHEVMPGEPDP